MLKSTEDLKRLYPNTKFGVLIIKGVENPSSNIDLNETKQLTKEQLLNQYQNYSRKEFTQTEPFCYYVNYYKKFKKTYPVLLQLESVILKSNPLPNTEPLVEAMFMAELKNLLLTAGHDLDKVEFPVKMDLSNGNEMYTGISGREKYLTSNDMMLSDSKGIISSILNGPDYRTRITKDTKNVMFFVYAPGGIDEQIIFNHLYDIKSYITLFSPNSTTDLMEIFN